jgi:hypothetical protein
MKKPEVDPSLAPVEPLSDLSWQRIERGLLRRLDGMHLSVEEPPAREKKKPPRGVGLVLAGAAAALLGIVGWRLLMVPPSGTPSRIVTAESPTRVAIGESALEVAPKSALVVSGDDERGLLVLLEQGTVTCEVGPRHGRPPFRVQAGEVQVRVIGTRFSVARAGDGAQVDVAHGVVEVTARGQTVLVGAGEHWPPPIAPPVPAPAAPSHLVEVEPIHRHRMTLPPISVAAAPPPAIAAPPPPPVAAPAPPPPIAPPPPPSAQERYEGAARLEAKDPAGAIAIYRSLETGSDAWAANALYAHGRLEADRGQRVEARRLLHAYVVRFPGGANGDDARHLLERLR